MRTDFGRPWQRGPLPPEALEAELIVGFLDVERAAGVEWTGSEFKTAAATYYAHHNLEGACSITDEELRHVREKRRELLTQWATLPEGETLELHFGQPT